MHLEVLVEDASGGRLLETLMPKLLGEGRDQHSYRIHNYKGIGRIPKGLAKAGDPSKRILLDQLPRLLKGYGKTPGIDAVMIVLDSDRNDCRSFLDELLELAAGCVPAPKNMFRLAIEEVEAWYFGDREALLQAYPRAKNEILKQYQQDSICGTWELLADAIYPGGSKAIKDAGWPLPGQVKVEWAERIGPLLELERNVSPSFTKLKEGVSRLTT